MLSRDKVLGFLLSALVFLWVGPNLTATAGNGPALGPDAKFKKIITIVLENTAYEDALRQPFLAALARRGAVLTNLTAVAHPSQPNYIALISGSTQGVDSDRNVDLDGRHIGDLLEAKGLTWKAYVEGYPGGCFLGGRKGKYVRKHVPFLSFRNVQTDPARCANIVDASQMEEDLRDGTLPDYSLYVPDLDDDGHDTDATFADAWLSKSIGPFLGDPNLPKDLLLVVTFDEGETSSLFSKIFSYSNRVLTVLVGAAVAPGSRSDIAYDTYSLLRLVEDEFHLGSLDKGDSKASVIDGIWK